ncbi:MAG: DUF5666 domain-containing protein [Candidatus Gribaldobacteria bacterium]|nr:DUF5666 domain-containing protein [Candidatus Gribaldobacteria bacterium]
MKKNIIIAIAIIVAIVVGVGSFYGGMQYGKSKSAGGGLANLTPEQRQARFQQMAGGANTGVQRATRNGGGLAMGEIISKDANSVTVKLSDGGSKIAFIATSTQVMKFAAGSLDDLIIGQNVSISGATNQDGSLTAQSIQLRPKPATPAVTPQ